MMDEASRAAWYEANGRYPREWVGPLAHSRGSWQYECGILIADHIEDDHDKLIIARSTADGARSVVCFSSELPHRDPLLWQVEPEPASRPEDSAEALLRRYADVLAATGPLVDLDAEWAARTDIPGARRAQLREAVDRGWPLIQGPVDQEYTAAYRDAKAPLAGIARTPDQLRAWLADTGPRFVAAKHDTVAVTLAFPDGATPTEPAPEDRPHPNGPEPGMSEGLLHGRPR